MTKRRKLFLLLSVPVILAVSGFIFSERYTPIVRHFDDFVQCISREVIVPGSSLGSHNKHPRRLPQLYRVTLLFWSSYDVRFDTPGHIGSTIPNASRPFRDPDRLFGYLFGGQE